MRVRLAGVTPGATVTPLARVALVAAAGLLLVANAPRLLGWGPHVVLSGSMRPALRASDVVVTSPVGRRGVQPGDIVLVRTATGSYVHRVRVVLPGGAVLTRGDANASDDFPPVPPTGVAGRVRLVVPLVGLPAAALHGHGRTAFAAATAFAAVAAARRVPGRRRPAGRRVSRRRPERSRRRATSAGRA